MDVGHMECDNCQKGGVRAETTVFVDDAVLGRLPGICVKSGVEAIDRLSITVPVGGSNGFGVAWLLVLAGPIGWIGLVVYGMVRKVEVLTVRLPYCDAACLQHVRDRRTKRHAGLACVVTCSLALLAAISHTFTPDVAAAALAVVGFALLAIYIERVLHVRGCSVGVTLDGSRRWVTLSRVCDTFADAVKESQAAHEAT
jgi:hypothetical protein